MLTPVHALSARFFYPSGNTPAVSLIDHQPPDNGTAEILLLGCGDIRNILYTVFCNQTGARDGFRGLTSCFRWLQGKAAYFHLL
jgi:hypothetical protein